MGDSQRPLSSEEMVRRARRRLDDPESVDAAPIAEPPRALETVEAPIPHKPASETPTDAEPPEQFEPETPPTRGRSWRIPGRLIVFLLIMGGVFAYNLFTDARRDDTGAVVEAGEVSADQIRVGDCLLYPADAEVAQDFEFEALTAVPCAEPHHMEVFASFERSDAVYPGEDALFDIADGLCAPKFEAYTGVSPDLTARLTMSSIVPDAQAWSNGDTDVLCVVESFDGTAVTGTQQGQALLGFVGLEVGKCYTSTETETYVGFTELGCELAHDVELYSEFELTDPQSSPFPGDSAVNSLADEECFSAYEPYVGQAWVPGESPDYLWVTPNEDSWAFGDRLVQCFLADPDGGILEGSPGSGA